MRQQIERTLAPWGGCPLRLPAPASARPVGCTCGRSTCPNTVVLPKFQPPVGQLTVQEQLHGLAAVRVAGPPCTPQGQETDRRRLNPGVRPLDPRPALQRGVVAVHQASFLHDIRRPDGPAADGQQPAGGPSGGGGPLGLSGGRLLRAAVPGQDCPTRRPAGVTCAGVDSQAAVGRLGGGKPVERGRRLAATAGGQERQRRQRRRLDSRQRLALVSTDRVCQKVLDRIVKPSHSWSLRVRASRYAL